MNTISAQFFFVGAAGAFAAVAGGLAAGAGIFLSADGDGDGFKAAGELPEKK